MATPVKKSNQVFILTQGVQGPPGPPGAGGVTGYVRETPMVISVGGATAGTTFDGSIVDALDKILYPYVNPSFSSFALSGYSTLEVGAEIPAGPATFTWATSNSANITPDSIVITDVTNAITLLSGGANDSGEIITLDTARVRDTAGAHTFRIAAQNTNEVSFSRDYSVNWYWRVWYGESEDTSLDTEPEVEALRASLLASSPNRTYNFEGGGYKWLAHPTSMGLKTTFTDADTGFPVAMEVPITVALTNGYGVTTNYYVYRTYNTLGGSIRITVS